MVDTDKLCKFFLELGVEAAGGEPTVQTGFDHVFEFLSVQHFT